MAEVLTTRALGRATLARQGLLEPLDMPVLEAVEHLGGLQAQAPQAPYVGLWSRLRAFDPAELSALLEERRAVRVVLQRSTIHLVSARDAVGLRPLVQLATDRSFRAAWGKRLGDADVGEVGAAARELVEAQPLTFAEIGQALAPRWPHSDPEALGQAARVALTLVQVPPRGLWRRGGLARHTTLEHWCGAAGRGAAHAMEDLVERHLRAFGPASVMDVQAWAGVTHLRAVVDGMRDRLAVFRSEEGVELFDLPDAPRPDPDTPAPVRLVPEYDNLLVAHAERSRVIADAHRERVFMRGAVLVDGMVCGAWRARRAKGEATLEVEPFHRLSKRARGEVGSEGERLLAFLEPDAARRAVAWT